MPNGFQQQDKCSGTDGKNKQDGLQMQHRLSQNIPLIVNEHPLHIEAGPSLGMECLLFHASF